MSLQPTKEAALQVDPLPIVVKHAAFEISAASYDEITRILRAREYHHVFDKSNGAIYMDNIALTRGKEAKEFCSAFVLENNKPGDKHRYLDIDENGVLTPSSMITEKTARFAREHDARSFAKLVANLGPVCSSVTWEPVPHLWG